MLQKFVEWSLCFSYCTTWKPQPLINPELFLVLALSPHPHARNRQHRNLACAEAVSCEHIFSESATHCLPLRACPKCQAGVKPRCSAHLLVFPRKISVIEVSMHRWWARYKNISSIYWILFYLMCSASIFLCYRSFTNLLTGIYWPVWKDLPKDTDILPR